MNIFEHHLAGSDRRISHCSYCRKADHNKNDCPHAAEDWQEWKDLRVPLNTTNIACTWMKSPKYWGEWYTKCRELVRHQELLAKVISGTKIKRTARARLCGFCREAGHTRRNCEMKKDFLADAYKANENWRKAAYDYLVNQKGISVGAILKVRKRQGYSSEWKPYIATIKSISWDTINVCTSSEHHNGSWNQEDYRSHLKIEILVDGEIRCLSQYESRASHAYNREKEEDNSLQPLPLTDGKIFAHKSMNDSYGSFQFIKVLSRAEKKEKADEVWASEGYREAFEFLANKRTAQKLREDDIMKTICEWL